MKVYLLILGFAFILLSQKAYSQHQNTSNGQLFNKSSSTNNILINVPANTTKVEVTLSNAKTQAFPSEQNINSIIAAGGAISGGIIGSLLTYLNTVRIENKKISREDEKLQNFNSNIRLIVYNELTSYKDFISNEINKAPLQLKKSQPSADADIWFVSDSEVPQVKLKLLSLPQQYKDIQLEAKANAFKGTALTQTESAYEAFRKFELFTTAGHPGCFRKSQVNYLLNLIDTSLSLIPHR